MMPTPGRRAFTLIELLVVVAILALLMSILSPSLRRAGALARRTACAANLKQIGSGVAIYASQQNGQLPCKTSGAGSHLSCVHWIRWFRVNNDYWNLGLLYKTQIAVEGELFYCPDQPNRWFQLATYAKPWPSNYQSGTSANGVRISYAFSPYVKDPLTPDKSRLYTRLVGMPPGSVLACDALENQSTVAHGPDYTWCVLHADGGVGLVTDPSIHDDELARGGFGNQNFPALADAVRKLERK